MCLLSYSESPTGKVQLSIFAVPDILGHTVILLTQTQGPTIRNFAYPLPPLVGNILMTDRLIRGFILFPLAQRLFWRVFLCNLHFQFLYCCTLERAGLYQGHIVTFSSVLSIDIFIVQSILCLFIPLFSRYTSACLCVCDARGAMGFPLREPKTSSLVPLSGTSFLSTLLRNSLSLCS